MKNYEIDMPSVYESIIELGMNKTGDVQKYTTHQSKLHMDKHLPYDEGNLANEAKEENDKVIYGPEGSASNLYARFVYYGKLMVDPETGSAWARRGVKKVLTDRNLTFKGAPQRGSHWDKKMIADSGDQLIKEVQQFVDKR